MAVTNALMKIGENALAKAGEKAVEKAATNALTKAGTGTLTKLTMDAVLPKATRSALTSLLSPNSGFTSVLGRIADKNGTPLSLYHSTPYEFSRFDDSKLGTNTLYDNTAYGHFATPDKDFSSRFLDIDNTGQKGRTMELQAKIKNPITHPYGASAKYSGDELDNIVENYMLATGNGEGLDMLREEAMGDGMSLYDEYMNATMDESPFELAKYERKDLMDKGYDGMEIVEGLKNDLVDGSKSKAPISSIVAFEGKNLSPVSHIPVQNMSSGAMDIPVESGVADRVSKYMSKPIDVKDMSSGSLPVAVDNDDGVINLGQLAERKSIPIQHGDNRPDITTGAELRLADNPFGTHEGVLFSSDKGVTPVGSDGSSDYRNMFYGNTNNQKVLDITDPYNAQALERTLGVRGFADRNGVDMLGDIRSGVTETMGDKGGTLGELLKNNDIGFIKGRSGLKDNEYVAANAEAIQRAYGGDTIARSMEYLDNPGSTLKNLRVGKDVTGDVQRLIDSDRSLSRLQNSPARGMLGNEQIQAYKRALNGENLSDEFLKNDKFARVLDEEVSKRPLLITPEQEANPSLIDPKMLSEFKETARKFINQNLDGVERGRKAVIVLGRPSSGKSSGAVNLYTNKKGGGFFELDNDEIKKLLPGYDDGMGANAVHNASSLISKKMVLPELADNGYNIVLPVVGKKESSVMSYVDELANRGYEIAMINTNLPVEKCRTRNRTRAYETGRNVADAYLVSVGEKPDLVYNSIKEKIKNGTERRIGSYAEVSTDVPFGEKAILVENSGGELLARLSD